MGEGRIVENISRIIRSTQAVKRECYSLLYYARYLVFYLSELTFCESGDQKFKIQSQVVIIQLQLIVSFRN